MWPALNIKRQEERGRVCVWGKGKPVQHPHVERVQGRIEDREAGRASGADSHQEKVKPGGTHFLLAASGTFYSGRDGGLDEDSELENY